MCFILCLEIFWLYLNPIPRTIDNRGQGAPTPNHFSEQFFFSTKIELHERERVEEQRPSG